MRSFFTRKYATNCLVQSMKQYGFLVCMLIHTSQKVHVNIKILIGEQFPFQAFFPLLSHCRGENITHALGVSAKVNHHWSTAKLLLSSKKSLSAQKSFTPLVLLFWEIVKQMLHLMVKMLHLSIHALITIDISVPIWCLHYDIRYLLTNHHGKWNQKFLLYHYTKHKIIYMLWCVSGFIGGSSFILLEISMEISCHGMQLNTWCKWLPENQKVKKKTRKSSSAYENVFMNTNVLLKDRTWW